MKLGFKVGLVAGMIAGLGVGVVGAAVAQGPQPVKITGVGKAQGWEVDVHGKLACVSPTIYAKDQVIACDGPVGTSFN